MAQRLASWQAGNPDEGTDLDGSDACPWDPNGDTTRLVEILGVDQEVTRELLTCLHEWTVSPTACLPAPER